MKCRDCIYLRFEKAISSRYYCTHSTITQGVGSVKVCTCDRHSTELKTKTSPKWCPLKKKEESINENI